MKNSGIIAWDDSDIPTWSKSGDEFLIRITRERTTVTSPTEDRVQIAAVTVFSWSKDGDITANSLITDTINSTGDITITPTGGDLFVDGTIKPLSDSEKIIGVTGAVYATVWTDAIASDGDIAMQPTGGDVNLTANMSLDATFRIIATGTGAGEAILECEATGDTVTANPETDAETGFIHIIIGGSARYIPFYTA